MLKIIKLIGISILCTTLSACSTLQLLKDLNPLSSNSEQTLKTPRHSNDENRTKLCANDDGIFSTCEDMIAKHKTIEAPKNSGKVPSLSSTDLSFYRLGEYTEQMAADLQRDVRGFKVDEPIVVASFVQLNSSLQTTNTLGIQLAELFINDLQQIGMPVADHKLMGVLDVNEKGDFAFSRNMKQFYSYVDIGYVLTGTMIKNSRGLIVNARLINFKTNAVVASSSKFLPNIVVNGLL